MKSPLRIVLLAGFAALLHGCVTQVSYEPIGPGALGKSIDAAASKAVTAQAVRAWRMQDESQELAGYVVLFASNNESQHYYSVRNSAHQELGTLDHLGRCWRFVPHAREASFLGAFTVREGCAAVLDQPLDALQPIALAELKSLAGQPAGISNSSSSPSGSGKAFGPSAPKPR